MAKRGLIGWHFLAAAVVILMAAGCGFGGLSTGVPRAASDEIEAGARLLEMDQKDLALQAFDRAVAVSPSNLSVYGAVSDLLQSRGLHEESIPYLRRALAVHHSVRTSTERSKYSVLTRALGDAYQFSHRFPEAEEAYRQSIALDNKDALAYNNWGYMYADLGVKPDDAVKLTQRAVDLTPDEGQYVDSLGWAYFKAGKYKKSLEVLGKAVELAPSEAEIRFHLGMALEKLGNIGAAWVEYRKALIIAPTHKNAAERLSILKI